MAQYTGCSPNWRNLLFFFSRSLIRYTSVVLAQERTTDTNLTVNPPRSPHAPHLQVSAIEKDSIDIDPDTKDLLDALDFKDLAGIAVSATPARV